MVSSGSSAHCVAPICETNHALFGSRKSTYTVVQICGTTSKRESLNHLSINQPIYQTSSVNEKYETLSVKIGLDQS